MTKRIIGSVVLVCFFGMWAGAQDRKLITLTSISYASAVYDAYTTQRALRTCDGCYEGNPLMRPFTGNSGSAYALTLGLTTATTYGTFRLKEKGWRWWWVPMAATIGLHITAGIHNQRIR